MELRLLGPLEACEGERVHRLAGKQGALLAVLVLDAGQVVSSDRLVDELWGDAPPESAVKAVGVFVWRLKRALPGLRVEKVGRGYRLDLDGTDRVDLHEFERLVAGGRVAAADGDPRRASRLLSEALGLWRGPPLADLDEPFARHAAARLLDLRVTAMEERIAADLDLGGNGHLAAEVEALVAEEPLRDPSVRCRCACSIAPAGRPTPWLRTRTRGARSSRSWGSSRRPRCSSSSARSCSRIPSSTGPPYRAHAQSAG